MGGGGVSDAGDGGGADAGYDGRGEMDAKNDASKWTTGGHVAGGQVKEQEEDDDWMYGGMKAFGGEPVGKGKEVAMGGEWEDGGEEVWVGSERFTKRMGM